MLSGTPAALLLLLVPSPGSPLLLVLAAWGSAASAVPDCNCSPVPTAVLTWVGSCNNPRVELWDLLFTYLQEEQPLLTFVQSGFHWPPELPAAPQSSSSSTGRAHLTLCRYLIPIHTLWPGAAALVTLHRRGEQKSSSR